MATQSSSVKPTNLDYSNYIFFWGEKNNFGFLSNFFPTEFEDGGVKFICSEQYFMKKKQELFDSTNSSLAELILSSTEPRQIKQFGRMVKNFNEEVWSEHKYQIMYLAVKNKFLGNPELAKRLIDTGDKILVEASPYDRIWGIGMPATAAVKIPESDWPGENLLGQILMEVRDELILLKNK